MSEQAIRNAAEIYCVALHNSDADALAALCHDAFFMTTMLDKGEPFLLNKQTFTDRARARTPFDGAPSWGIESIDVEPDMAHVKLWVDMPPRRFCDYLGFVPVNGEWKLITKLYRVAQGPAVDA